MSNLTKFTISISNYLELATYNPTSMSKSSKLDTTYWTIQNNLQLQVVYHRVPQKENMHIH